MKHLSSEGCSSPFVLYAVMDEDRATANLSLASSTRTENADGTVVVTIKKRDAVDKKRITNNGEKKKRKATTEAEPAARPPKKMRTEVILIFYFCFYTFAMLRSCHYFAFHLFIECSWRA